MFLRRDIDQACQDRNDRWYDLLDETMQKIAGAKEMQAALAGVPVDKGLGR